MPTCFKGICGGHRAKDVLPFKIKVNFCDRVGGDFSSISPSSEDDIQASPAVKIIDKNPSEMSRVWGEKGGSMKILSQRSRRLFQNNPPRGHFSPTPWWSDLLSAGAGGS